MYRIVRHMFVYGVAAVIVLSASPARALVHLHRSVCACSWERHAPAWLLGPGWCPAFPGTKALHKKS